MQSESESQPPLQDGDMVKIDVGCYIDGYIATSAHTLIVGKELSAESPVDGLQADVLLAAHQACEVASKLIRPGNTNQQVRLALSHL